MNGNALRRDLARLSHDRFDLLIVGGGAHGLAAAYDAAQRGLAVALVERDDFGSAASFNHLKTIHGGLRYMQTADLKRMRESIVERRTLARIAPHLLTPLPFLMPTYRKVTRSRLAMRVAFAVDALVGRDRNAGVAPRLHLPTGRLISRDQCLQAFPDVRARGLTGAAIWSDYQVRNTDRLTLAFAIAADGCGACLANHVEATGALREGSRIAGVRARDRVSGQDFDVRARVTLNAAGAGAGRVMGFLGHQAPFPLLKAMNLVTRRPMSGPALASSTDDGRMLFIVPWEGRAVAGTSHSQELAAPDDADVSAEELEHFISEVNQAFPALGLTPQDVSLVHRGIVPAVRGRKGLGLEGHYRVRDHGRDGAEGAVSLVGVKYTTARGVAAAAVDLIARKLGVASACRTGEVPLPGGEEPDLDSLLADARREAGGLVDADAAAGLTATYGTRFRDVLAIAQQHPGAAARLAPGVSVIAAQVLHAVRAEMALTLVDVVTRRTPLGAAGHPGRPAAEACARLMATELGWDQARVERELASLERFYAPVGPATAPRTA